MTTAGVVLVTRDSERWIDQTLISILGQTQSPDEIVVIDDGSTDRTREIVLAALGSAGRVEESTTTDESRITRIAANFAQGLRLLQHCDVVVLGDHDDVWYPERIAWQVGQLEAHPSASMLASDGRLVDGDGEPIGGTLRSVFPVPGDFNELDPGRRMQVTLRHSIATGGASAMRPAAFADVEIPEGWLHDRWWSMVATAREAMRVDDHVVIDYRVTADQEVGLDRGTQDAAGAARVSRAVSSGGAGAYRKLRDVQTRLFPLATTETRRELRTHRLLRTLVERD